MNDGDSPVELVEDEPSEGPSKKDSPEESPEDEPSEESSKSGDEDLHITLHGAFSLGWLLQYLRQAGHNQYRFF